MFNTDRSLTASGSGGLTGVGRTLYLPAACGLVNSVILRDTVAVHGKRLLYS